MADNKGLQLVQPNQLESEEWYIRLVEECKAIITEAVFTSRWALVEGYWNLGKRIKEEHNFKREDVYGKKILAGLRESIGISESTLYRSIQFYDKFPRLEDVPEGKNISWNKIVTNYLPKAREVKIELPSPEGKYHVIYADPPWDIGSMVLEKWESPLEDKYPTMTEAELLALDVASLCAEDSVCFMWTTLSTLPQALRLLEAWGFKYHITITWDKGGGWSSCGFHRRTELVIFGYRGVLSRVVKQEGEYIPTVFYEAKTTHSTKPEKMYQFIEDRANGKKIELFARNKRDGWEVWGNQIQDGNNN